METLILVLQVLCVGILVVGTGYSLFHIMDQSIKADRADDRFSFSAANDFETDFRRVSRQ